MTPLHLRNRLNGAIMFARIFVAHVGSSIVDKVWRDEAVRD
jgi:hypothetical protein